MSQIRFPDYNNCILNTVTSILKYYNVPTSHSSLNILDKKLYDENGNKKYKNIVFIILDGLGEHILNNISGRYLKKHELACITSVYPSTTTAALTSYYSGLSPYESGWIGWSQYFKEYGRAIDMLSHKESYKNDPLDLEKLDLNVFDSSLKYTSIFNKIEQCSPETKAYNLEPDYAEIRSDRTIRVNNVKEICTSIKSICDESGEKFIMAYSDNPDGLLHKYGCTSEEAKNMVIKAENDIEDLCNSLNLDETIVIVSADHGHKDINNAYTLLDYPEILDCLIMPASLESRSVAFWVKENKKEKFEKLFNDAFGDSFKLMTTKEALDMHLFGYGLKHQKIEDFLGNYLALSIGGDIIRLETFLAPGKPVKKSTHCGLTVDEMEVPLIVVDN